MTTSQQRAIALAYILLEEEFDHVLIAVRDKEVDGVIPQPDVEVAWHGGYVMAQYLAERAKEKMIRSRSLRRPPEVNPEIMNLVMNKSNDK